MRQLIKRDAKQAIEKHLLLRVSVFTVFSFFMSGCSQHQEMQRLQQDYHAYTSSSYVQDNVKPTSNNPVSTAQPLAKTNQQMQRAQQQLVANKSRTRNRIEQTIYNNALFPPPQNLQQTINALPTQAEQENWLKKHPNLPSILTLVLKNNPTIQRRLQVAKATLSQYDQVRFLDDTLAQYAAFSNKPSANNFPFPSLLTLKGSIVDQAAEISRLQLLQSVQDVLTQTRIAYYELQFAQQESHLVKKNMALLRSLKSQLSTNYATQTTQLQQIVKVDIDIEKQRNKYQQAQHRQQAEQARLNALLNFSPRFTLGKLKGLTPVKIINDTQQLLVTAKKSRVEIALLQSTIKKMAQVIQLSERRFYPDLSADYSRFKNRTAKQVGSNATEITFTTRPATTMKQRNFFGKDDAYLTETKQQYQALQAQLQALQRQTEESIQQTLSQYKAQKRSYSLYQSSIIPKAKTAATIVNNQYETSESNYLNIIDAQTVLLNAQLFALKAIKEANSKAAQLERLVGQG